MKTAPKKKVLFTSHVANFQKFNRPFMRMLKEQGWEVHYASDGEEKILDCDKEFMIPFERSPFKPGNIKAYVKLKKIIDREKYDMIHTHTPMGSVVTRLAARAARKKGTRVLYTAHGFHFFKGAPIANWLIYYPIEKYMARHTDTLITINNEDFERATAKFKTQVEYVPGVGVDQRLFEARPTKLQRNETRASLGIKPNDFVMIYPAELSKRKRQVWLINSIAKLIQEKTDLHLILPGKDSLGGECQRLVARLGLEKQIHFLGYRSDIPRLMMISDLSVSSSSQEGLPVNLMEALMARLPVVSTNSRGSQDLVAHGKSGYLVGVRDSLALEESILHIYSDKKKARSMSEASKSLLKSRTLAEVSPLMQRLYNANQYSDDRSPVRVLQVVTSMNRAGLETMLMNYYRNIDRSKVQFDFLVHRQDEGAYEAEILKLGGRIYRFPPITIQAMVSYGSKMKGFLADHPEYSIIHSHLDALSALPLRAAKKMKLPVRVAHSHNNGFARDITYPLRSVLKRSIARYATTLFACSTSAGNFMFGHNSNYTIIKNAIDIDEFFYNPVTRRKVRSELGLEEKYVVGHVGRFSHQKNHEFLINAFSDLAHRRQDAVLVLVGDGELSGDVRDHVGRMNLNDQVLFLGVRKDIPSLLQAMDIFVMPSRHEGLPVVSIEAQMAGLQCIFSDNVTDELDISGNCRFISLNSEAHWAEEMNVRVAGERYEFSKIARQGGYDIVEASRQLEKFYLAGSGKI